MANEGNYCPSICTQLRVVAMISAQGLMLRPSHWDYLTDVDFTDQALLFYTDPQNYLWKTKQSKQTNKQKHPSNNLEKFEQFFPWREAIWEMSLLINF